MRTRQTTTRVMTVTLTVLCVTLGAGLVFKQQIRDPPPADDPEPQVPESSKLVVPETEDSSAAISSSSTITFTDATSHSKMAFQYSEAPSINHYMTEQNGGGIAVFDFDNDGSLDVFLSNGSTFDSSKTAQPSSNCLFRSTDSLTYHDATVPARLEAFGFGQGVAAGDIDNDGFTDLFVASYGANRLWKNNGDGSFSESPLPLNSGSTWSTSAAFADLDGDGTLDLYVVNYVDWTPESPPCFFEGSQTRKKICSPIDFHAQQDVLLRNSADGQFEVAGSFVGDNLDKDGKGLAVAIADLSGDRKLDIYVANDTCRNFLFTNHGKLHFADTGITTGVAFSENGALGSSMGVALNDINGDGLVDLAVTNFAHEPLDVFLNLGDVGFVASNAELAVDQLSIPALNFGIVISDFDLDGWPDLFFTNGHLWNGGPHGDEYKMLPGIMRNMSGKQFVNVADTAGRYFSQKWLGRCASAGDLDNDGDTDLVIGHLDAPAKILRNDCSRGGKSIRLKFVGTHDCRQPLGSQVTAYYSDGSSISQVIPSGGSFQASHSPILSYPILANSTPKTVTIRWPSECSETWTLDPDARFLTLIQSTGTLSDQSSVGVF